MVYSEVIHLNPKPYIMDSLNKKQVTKVKKNFNQNKIEIIPECNMPDHVNKVRLTHNEEFLFILGAYKPMIKCFELDQLSVKFERHCNEEPHAIEFFTNDFSKFGLIEGSTSLTIHDRGGIVCTEKFKYAISDMAYSMCDAKLIISHDNSSLSCLDMNSGKLFYNVSKIYNSRINRCVYNKYSNVFMVGRQDGIVNVWDQRIEKVVGEYKFQPSFMQDGVDNIMEDSKISDIGVKDRFKFGLGTNGGFFQLFDIRKNEPTWSADMFANFPVHSTNFLNDNRVSLTTNTTVKILDMNQPDQEQQQLAFYIADVPINDTLHIPNSGVFLNACNESEVDMRYVPIVGDSPKWCPMLTKNLTDKQLHPTPSYTGFSFITPEQVKQYNLENLYDQPNALHAHQHGYYIPTNILKHAKSAFDKRSKEKSEMKVELEKLEKTVVKKLENKYCYINDDFDDEEISTAFIKDRLQKKAYGKRKAEKDEMKSKKIKKSQQLLEEIN